MTTQPPQGVSGEQGGPHAIRRRSTPAVPEALARRYRPHPRDVRAARRLLHGAAARCGAVRAPCRATVECRAPSDGRAVRVPVGPAPAGEQRGKRAWVSLLSFLPVAGRQECRLRSQPATSASARPRRSCVSSARNTRTRKSTQALERGGFGFTKAGRTVWFCFAHRDDGDRQKETPPAGQG